MPSLKVLYVDLRRGGRAFDIAERRLDIRQAFSDRGPFLGYVRVKRRDRFHPRHRLLLQVGDQLFRLVEHESHGERSGDIRGH